MPPRPLHKYSNIVLFPVDVDSVNVKTMFSPACRPRETVCTAEPLDVVAKLHARVVAFLFRNLPGLPSERIDNL